MPTSVVEDYLEQIYWMQENGQRVIGARLAERMHTAMPTVTETLKRMLREGLVSQDDHKEIRLTSNGRHAAESTIRRHALSERLLTDILGLSWVDAHAEAHKFEHILSEKVEERIMALLGNPSTCPHGNPIPNSGSSERPPRGIPLGRIDRPGEYRIVRVSEQAESDFELMGYLEQKHLKPGQTLRVLGKERFESAPLVEVQGERFPLGSAVAEAICVIESATAS